MMMTLRRLAPFICAVERPDVTMAEIDRLRLAIEQRRRERGPSKLSRRLRRKHGLGHAGAF